MAVTWYPVIDYSTCAECGTCVQNCPHGVYDMKKAPVPVVRNPMECVDHCHTCGNNCPAGAITYVGEDTGWTPPRGRKAEQDACGCGCDKACDCEGDCGCDCDCGCTCGEDEKKLVQVEYLYLDLETCDRCVGTDRNLDEVVLTLSPALRMAGYAVEYRKIKMETEADARQYRFRSSPTIRVNGTDICTSVTENECGCCSEISGSDVHCRVFIYQGQSFEVPPREMLAEAILKSVFTQAKAGCTCGTYTLPENLKAFYEGKASKSACSCGGSCCG